MEPATEARVRRALEAVRGLADEALAAPDLAGMAHPANALWFAIQAVHTARTEAEGEARVAALLAAFERKAA